MRKSSELSELSGTSKDKSILSMLNPTLELRRSERFKNRAHTHSTSKNSLEVIKNVRFGILIKAK